MTLDGGAVRVQLPTAFNALHPTVIDDVLYVAIQQGGSADPPPLDQVRLVAVDLTDPTRIHRTWSAADLIPDVAEDRQPPPRLIIRHLRAADGDLLLQAQFEGPSWDGEDARSAWRSYRYVFYPDAERISWTLDLSSPDLDTQPSPVHRHTDDVRAALVSESAHEVSEPGLRLFRSRGGHVDITPSGHSCVLPRAVLDSAGPTVLYSLHEPTGPDDYGNELVFAHRGRDVARVKQLKDGLNKRRAHIQSLAVLEQP